MRRFGMLMSLVLASGGLASCVTQENPLVNAEASIDQSSPLCTTNADCTGGLVCSFETLVGCSAKGECRDLGPDAGAGACVSASTACGCDGKPVHIPECWMGFAPAPVLPGGGACTDAKSG